MGFVGNLVVPKAIHSGPAGLFWPSLLTNALLLSLFAVQHSGMARPAFKRWWTRLIPWPLEERDLLARLGELCAVYRRRVPMLVPKGAGVCEQTLESEVGKAGAAPR